MSRSERTNGAYRLFESAGVYRLFQQIVGANQARARFAREFVVATPGLRVLDLGCGTGEIVAFLPEVRYTGIDVRASYIEAARRTRHVEAEFLVGDLEERLPFADGSFDAAIAFGLLHHLSDVTVERLLRETLRVLAGSGRLVTIDGVRCPGQHWVARCLVSMDRGRFVRREESLAELATSAGYSPVRTVIRHDLLRIPYSHIILDCRKPAPI